MILVFIVACNNGEESQQNQNIGFDTSINNIDEPSGIDSIENDTDGSVPTSDPVVENESESLPEPASEPERVNLINFGYYWSAIYESAYGDAIDPVEITDIKNLDYRIRRADVNYIKEYSNHANTSWMLTLNDSIDARLLDEARKYNQKVVIDLARFFNPYINERITLDEMKSRIKTWWDNFMVKNNYAELVYFLVPHDEPFHLFGANENTIKRVNDFSDIIKEYTSAKSGISFHPKQASDTGFQVSPNYTYLGFYCYEADDLDEKCGTGGRTLPDTLNVLSNVKSLNSQTRLFAIGPGRTRIDEKFRLFKSRERELQVSEDLMIHRMNVMYQAARQNPRVEFLASFLWRGLVEKDIPRVGTRDLPGVRARSEEIGKAIISGLIAESQNVETCNPFEYYRRRPDVQRAKSTEGRHLTNTAFTRLHWDNFGHKEDWNKCRPY